MLRPNSLLLLAVLFLSGCFATKSQVANVENDLNQVAEKVDALLTHSNSINDSLVDLDLRMDTLEQDARKRGVPTRIKGVDLANNTAPSPYSANPSPTPLNPSPTKNQPLTAEQRYLPVQNMNVVSDNRKISDEHYLPEGMSYGKNSNDTQSLDFPNDAETDQVAENKNIENQPSSQSMGSITGQDLTQANAPLGQIPQVNGTLTANTSGLTPKTPSVSMHTPPPGNYDYALNLYKQRKYKEAEQAFDAFLQANPQDVLAPNALSWKGETYYARGDYPKAIFTFKDVQTRYPKHPKAADSLLKTGMSYAMLGDENNANLHYTVLQEDFPNSSATKQIPKF